MRIDKLKLETWISKHTEGNLCIEITNRIIGGRYGDAWFKIISYQIIENSLILEFKSPFQETNPISRLWIKNPKGIKLKDDSFKILTGDIIRFGFYYNGKEVNNLNWCENIYFIENDKVKRTEIGPLDTDMSKYSEYEINLSYDVINISVG